MGPELVAANLRRLREQRGLTQDALAEAAGISRLTYRNIETRKSVPRVDTLQALAMALQVGIEALVAPVPHLKYARFRSLKRLNSREQVLADIARRLADYNDLERLLKVAPVAVVKPRVSSNTTPVALARLVRDKFGIGEKDPVRDICGLLEAHGYKVLLVNVASDAFFGLSVAQEDGGPAVVVNNWERISVERRIFSAAHELGHLLLHPAAYDVQSSEEVDAEERQANEFASHFLMPHRVFRSEWDDTVGLRFVTRVLKVKGIFRVSYKSVLYRLKDDHPGANFFARFQAEHQKMYGATLTRTEEPEPVAEHEFYAPEPMKAREPDEASPNAFVQDRLYKLVRRAVDTQAITLSRAAEILGISTQEMHQLSESWLA